MSTATKGKHKRLGEMHIRNFEDCIKSPMANNFVQGLEEDKNLVLNLKKQSMSQSANSKG
jgi:hypothetical protein